MGCLGFQQGTFSMNGAMQPIVFRSADFVNITLSGLREQTKPRRNTGKTRRKKVVRFTDKRVEWAKGMFTCSKGDSISEWIEQNVVYVWFADKK